MHLFINTPPTLSSQREVIRDTRFYEEIGSRDQEIVPTLRMLIPMYAPIVVIFPMIKCCLSIIRPSTELAICLLVLSFQQPIVLLPVHEPFLHHSRSPSTELDCRAQTQ